MLLSLPLASTKQRQHVSKLLQFLPEPKCRRVALVVDQSFDDSVHRRSLGGILRPALQQHAANDGRRVLGKLEDMRRFAEDVVGQVELGDLHEGVASCQNLPNGNPYEAHCNILSCTTRGLVGDVKKLTVHPHVRFGFALGPCIYEDLRRTAFVRENTSVRLHAGTQTGNVKIHV